jgi:plasmid stabilization system protein ParE
VRGIQRTDDYLFDFNPHAAAHIAETILDEANSLMHFPHRGHLVPGTSMRELIKSYPYIIRHRIDRDEVIILRIRHTSRRPTTP